MSAMNIPDYLDVLSTSQNALRYRDLIATVSDEDVNDLVKGAIDAHVHAGPDVARLRYGMIEMAKQATELGMGALCWKDHFTMSAPAAWLVQYIIDEWAREKNLKPVQVYGGIVLNYSVGGLNPLAVAATVRYPDNKGKMIWMPTFSASHGYVEVPDGIVALTDKDELKPEMMEIIDIISKAKTRAILAVPHMTHHETLKIAEACREAGAVMLVDHVATAGFTHPAQLSRLWKIDELQKLADLGCYLGVGAEMAEFAKDAVKIVNTIGAQHIVLTSDRGALNGIPQAISVPYFIRCLLMRGITKQGVRTIVKENGERMLGIKV